MYSVELAETYYRNPEKKSGYLIRELEAKGIPTDKHTFFVGDILPSYIDKIGSGIDFLILDTMHVLPGEILDFLVTLPYLKRNAVVVIHDTCLQHLSYNYKAIATNVLFGTVVANKFLNNQEVYPSIAAFQISSDTYKYILDVFNALMIPWTYMLNDYQQKKYRAVYQKFYCESCLKLYDQASLASLKTYERNNKWNIEQYFNYLKCSIFHGFEKIYIYGTGKRGTTVLWYLENYAIKIDGFIVSDDHYNRDNFRGYAVIKYSNYSNSEGKLIVLAADSKELEEKLFDSGYCWFKIPDTYWWKMQYFESENIEKCRSII